MAKFLLKRNIKKYYGEKVTDIIGNNLNLNLDFKTKEAERLAAKNPEAFINALIESLKINGRYTYFKYYVKTGNPYKKQAYLNGKYYLTINTDNIKTFEKDFNFLKAAGVTDKDIKRILKKLYLIE